MKFNFRKIASALASSAMVGSTVALAAAASFPAPFVDNGAADVTIVYGSAFDVTAVTDVTSALSVALSSQTVVSGSSITGGSADLASGSDLLYLNDEFSENVQTLTKDDLPTVLADGTFTDDDGTDYDFEQSLTIGTSTNNGFEFGNSDNDLDDPALMLKLSTTSTATNAIYDLTATFNTAVPFNATDSEGEDLTIFGKTYTVGTATDADTLVLLGGAGSSIVDVGETESIAVGSDFFDVTLVGLSSATVTQASVDVNGETKTFTEGQTKTMSGVDVYVKTIFRTGDDLGYVEVQLGADKLTLENGNAVQVGSDTDDVDGTLVTITGGVNAMTEIKFTMAAEDNDVNHLLVGESFPDPVFGTILVNFDSIENGPTFTDEKDTGRTDLEIQKGGNRELQLSITDNAGHSATLPFTYQAALSDDNSNVINVVEGATLSDDEYFILNSGNNQHFMQITKMNVDDNANSDVAMKDLISGETYTFDNHAFVSGYSATIAGQTYTITNDSTTTVTVVSSDYGTGIADGNDVDVFPMIELVSGEDTRVAMTDDVQVMTNFISGGAADGTTVTLNLPTGTATVANSATNTSVRVAGTSGTAAEVTNGTNDSFLVGDVYYNFAVVGSLADNSTNVTVSVDATPGADSDAGVTTPGILFVEDEDKSETTTTTKPAIHIVTTDTGSYSTVSAPLFTGTSDTETWDDTDLTGWLTNYGTYVWRDTSDDNQNFVGLSYGDDIMSANVLFAEGAVTTDGTATLGDVSVLDTELASSGMSGNNLIVVGGSCVNSVAADLLGVSAGTCGSDWSAATGGLGEGDYVVETFDQSNGKVATLVAGWSTEDTSSAATLLANGEVSTSVGSRYVNGAAL